MARFLSASFGFLSLSWAVVSPVEPSPKIGFHVREVSPPDFLSCQFLVDSKVPCSQWVTTARLHTPYEVYLLIAGADSGVSQASLGLVYEEPGPGSGIDVFGFRFCGDVLEFQTAGPYGAWPAPWSGARLIWRTCQQSPV